MPIDTSKTGAAIAAYRQRMNMSQQGLAGLMNVTHQAVSKWEKGLALPDTETLLALAKLFGISMEDLLMGKQPAEPAKEAEKPAEEAAAPAGPEPVQPADLGDLDFSSVMNMLPFVSTKAADHLFRIYTQSSQPDAGQLISLAPFVSTRVLADYVSAHPLNADSPETVASLAPFLPTKTVDEMIRTMDAPLPPHVLHMVMPFASAKVVDEMVMGTLGLSWEESAACSEANSSGNSSGRPMQDRIHQKILQKINRKLDPKNASHPLSADAKRAAQAAQDRRETPRMRLIRKAIEDGNEEMLIHMADELDGSEKQALAKLLMAQNMYDLLADLFDELDDETRSMLLSELTETGDAKLLPLFCEAAGELDPNAQSALVQLLLKGKLYGELAEVIDELDEAVQHELLDRAFEISDPELLHIISEHL